MNQVELAELIHAWDAQQAAYISQREARFAIMFDAIARYLPSAATTTTPTTADDGSGLVVLDLACGPGSLSQRILDRFPGAQVIGVDYDPALLHLAQAWLSSRHPRRFTAIDADLTRPWPDSLSARQINVAVSSTALHWLEPAHLVGLYARLAQLLPPGGLFLNADHLRYDAVTQPFLTASARADDARTQAHAFAAGVLTWEQWWERLASHPELAADINAREQRFADRPPTTPAPLSLHLSALHTAGFAETGVIWQLWDDIVTLARR